MTIERIAEELMEPGNGTDNESVAIEQVMGTDLIRRLYRIQTTLRRLGIDDDFPSSQESDDDDDDDDEEVVDVRDLTGYVRDFARKYLTNPCYETIWLLSVVSNGLDKNVRRSIVEYAGIPATMVVARELDQLAPLIATIIKNVCEFDDLPLFTWLTGAHDNNYDHERIRYDGEDDHDDDARFHGHDDGNIDDDGDY
jgi:hypothetical protein